jgi:arsenite oxidase large subunit
MAYKRKIDRLPIIPAGAKEHDVTCHYRVVGCGYKAHTWLLKTQGTVDSNWIGENLSKQQGAATAAWYAPSMYNIVKRNGRDVHLVMKPDVDCVVNSARGARMAENRRSDIKGTQQPRVTDPVVWRFGTWQPTSWNNALGLVARITARVIDKYTENDLYVSMFNRGGWV